MRAYVMSRLERILDRMIGRDEADAFGIGVAEEPTSSRSRPSWRSAPVAASRRLQTTIAILLRRWFLQPSKGLEDHQSR